MPLTATAAASYTTSASALVIPSPSTTPTASPTATLSDGASPSVTPSATCSSSLSAQPSPAAPPSFGALASGTVSPSATATATVPVSPSVGAGALGDTQLSLLSSASLAPIIGGVFAGVALLLCCCIVYTVTRRRATRDAAAKSFDPRGDAGARGSSNPLFLKRPSSPHGFAAASARALASDPVRARKQQSSKRGSGRGPSPPLSPQQQTNPLYARRVPSRTQLQLGAEGEARPPSPSQRQLPRSASSRRSGDQRSPPASPVVRYTENPLSRRATHGLSSRAAAAAAAFAAEDEPAPLHSPRAGGGEGAAAGGSSGTPLLRSASARTGRIVSPASSFALAQRSPMGSLRLPAPVLPAVPAAAAHAPGSPEGALPPGWEVRSSRTTGRAYFHCRATGETTHKRPRAAAGAGEGIFSIESPLPRPRSRAGSSHFDAAGAGVVVAVAATARQQSPRSARLSAQLLPPLSSPRSSVRLPSPLLSLLPSAPSSPRLSRRLVVADAASAAGNGDSAAPPASPRPRAASLRAVATPTSAAPSPRVTPAGSPRPHEAAAGGVRRVLSALALDDAPALRAPPARAAPPSWETRTSRRTGRTFYLILATGETTFECPGGPAE